MKTIEKKKLKNGIDFIAIVKVEDWWVESNLYGRIPVKYPLLSSDFVVCKWSDFHDGVNSHIEGKTTIAICREKADAIILFNHHSKEKSKTFRGDCQ